MSHSVHYTSGNGRQKVYTVDQGMSNPGRGALNNGYHNDPSDHHERYNYRPSGYGHANTGYEFSDVGSKGSTEYIDFSMDNNLNLHSKNGGKPVPKPRIYNDTTRYRSDATDGQATKLPNKENRKRRCIIAIVVTVVLLIIVGVAIFLGVYFGTDAIQKRTTQSPSTAKTTNFTSVTSVSLHDNLTTTETPTTSTTAGITGSTEAPIADTAFSGQIKIDKVWKPELENSNSPEFLEVAKKFEDTMDAQMKADPSLSLTYNRTDVLNLMQGSIIVIFRIMFNQPTPRTTVETRCSAVLSTPSVTANLGIITGSLVIKEYSEQTACGAEDRMLCDNVCRNKNEIACNNRMDCSDWFDESNCPGKSVSCDFESSQTCGYTLEGRGSNEYSWTYKAGETGTADTGPSYDRTYMNASGHYYYTEWCRSCANGVTALLTSPVYVTRQAACLTFYYSMIGDPLYMGPLYVSSYDNFNRSKVLWTRENPDLLDSTNMWNQVQVNITAGSYRFIFASFMRTESERGDKAIDDISIRPGVCPTQPGCSDSTFCPVTYKCMKTFYKPSCNGRFECPNQVDEANCSGYSVQCSFESGSLTDCNLRSVSSSDPNYAWRIFSSSSPVVTQGTYYDYTYKNQFGHYAAVLPGQTQPGAEAKLQTPVVSSNTPRCLQFAYNMNDDLKQQSGALQVFARYNSSTSLILNQTQRTGRDWLFFTHSLQPRTEPYYIEFIAVRGQGSGLVVSIDDITLKEGLCQCTQSGRSQCFDKTCIPDEWFCDGYRDCSQGEDEVNCLACPSTSYQCRDGSCVTGGPSIRCDRSYDCPDGSDEAGCAILDMCATEECVNVKHTDNNYYGVCASGWNSALNADICKYVFKGKPVGDGVTAASPGSTKFLQLTNPSGPGFQSLFTLVDSCPSNRVLKVQCEAEACGRPLTNLSPYIIGGSAAPTQGRWPWQVDLQFMKVHVCGATLLNKHWIITASHCISGGKENEPSSWRVLLGSSRVTAGQSGSAVYNVTKIVLHPKYISGYVFGGSDIALLFIEQEITFSDFIKPACLPDKDASYTPRSFCYLTGWGIQELPGTYPDILQESKYKIVDMQSCNASSGWNGIITHQMVCAGYPTGTIRSCKGDSGGPLVCKDKLQRWNLAGITSFGPGGCLLQNHKADVFTKVSTYLDWVRTYIDFQFTCRNGKQLLDFDMLCDGFDNCGDNSDETTSCSVSLACDFDVRNNCGYNVNSWYKTSGTASTVGQLQNTGPTYDHTFGVPDGRHFYFFTANDGARLIAPPHNAPTTNCLEFYFFISSSNNKIRVLNGASTLGEVSGTAQIWRRGQINLPSGSSSIIFHAVVSDKAYVALDDVKVTSGQCATSCDSDKFKCGDNNACIPKSAVCDGVSNCLDGSDESSCSNTNKPVTCSFFEPWACGFQQVDADTFNWIIQNTPSDDRSSGPPSGRSESLDIEDTTYLIAKAPKAHDVSVISWPLALKTSSCFTFYYYMYGTNVGTLSVSSDGTTLWQKAGNQGQQWFRADVQLAAGKSVLITTQSAAAISNSVALDDLSVMPGTCPDIEKCSESQIKCGTSCLPSSSRCDKVANCYDLTDELSCSWSLDCSFTSPCPSYSIQQSRIGIYTWKIDPSGGTLIASSETADLGSHTNFTSAPFLLASPQCLSFDYLLQGSETGSSELRVVLSAPFIKQLNTVWRASRNQPAFKNIKVTLTPSSQSVNQLIFQSFYGGNKNSSIKLDNIAVSPGACIEACSGFFCSYESKCISATLRCDGTNDCMGGQDESNCGDLPELLDCNFDESFCQWKRPQSSLQLVRFYGQTPKPNTGPIYDHTWANNLGYFVYLDSGTSSGEAKLVSPTFKSTTPMCLSFMYSMLGANIGYLNVTNLNSTQKGAIISLLGASEHGQWHRAKISVQEAEAITLLFTLTSTGDFGNLAIDDIKVRAGNCTCNDGFACKSGECFDKIIECDDRIQCISHEDENKCECPNGDYRCADGSMDCFPVDVICSDNMQNCIADGETVNCTCAAGDMRCGNGLCFHPDQYCNGYVDCQDGSDEPTNCADNCPQNHVACRDKKFCIKNEFWCDGFSECSDRSDELEGCVKVGGSSAQGK